MVSIAPTAMRRHTSGIFFFTIVLLAVLLISYPQFSYGQATEAEITSDGDVTDLGDVPGDVTDLGDVVGDTMAEDLDLDVDNVGEEEEVATDTTEEVVEDEKVVEDTAIKTQSDGETVDNTEATEETPATEEETPAAPVVQSGPFIDLLGDTLLSLQMVSETQAQVNQHYTNDALSGKKVVGLYFSADWCGPCRQFTPDLVSFYNKMNARRGKQDQFEIVWISRCRDVDSFGQYFTQMNWLALPPDQAMGERGQYLGELYKVKGIPSLVLLDEIGNVITTDARNKIPADKAGIGFPWRSPISILVSTLVPRSFRLLVKSQFSGVLKMVKGVIQGKKDKLTQAVQAAGQRG